MQKPRFRKNKLIEEMIRVDHAGEYGASRIYTGQIDKISSKNEKIKIKYMYEQELVHLRYFEDRMRQRRIRPTLLMPLWHVFGYMLGSFSARLGSKSAMICTEAVETVIDVHYEKQKALLTVFGIEREILNSISKFQQEELEHKEVALDYTTNLTFRDKLLLNFTKAICKVAIFISKKI